MYRQVYRYLISLLFKTLKKNIHIKAICNGKPKSVQVFTNSKPIFNRVFGKVNIKILHFIMSQIQNNFVRTFYIVYIYLLNQKIIYCVQKNKCYYNIVSYISYLILLYAFLSFLEQSYLCFIFELVSPRQREIVSTVPK